MNWFKYILTLVVLTLITAFTLTDQVYSFEFGIKLYPTGGSLITTAVVTVNNGKVIRDEVVSEHEFLLELSGTVSSKANPAPVDLFFKNGIYSCSREKDTIRYKHKVLNDSAWIMNKTPSKYKTEFVVQELKVECPLLKELWRVRYKYDIRLKNYNYTQNPKATGWSNDRFWPTLTQVNYLKANYGSDGINEYIYGDNLYKFLKDVQDTAWIANYKSLR